MFKKQNNNSLEIARLSGSLYDKFVGFTEDMIDIGKKIDQSKAGYIDAMKKLTDGNGNLIKTSEKIKELGAKASKSLNAGLLQRSEWYDLKKLFELNLFIISPLQKFLPYSAQSDLLLNAISKIAWKKIRFKKSWRHT